MITQTELQKFLNYNPDTGVFTWILCTANRMSIGDKAGGKSVGEYSQIKILGKAYMAHRLAWMYVYGEFPQLQIDHINGVKNDNRIINLRSATPGETKLNVGKHKDNTSGFKGVTWNKSVNKRQAQGRVNGKNHYLGIFTTPELASLAFEEFAKQHHGAFHCRNVADFGKIS